MNFSPVTSATTTCAILGWLSISSSAHAQSSLSDADRAAARGLAEIAAADYKHGDYAAAEDKFARAFSVAKIPKVGLWYARALVKVGKLVEASERYADVTRLEATGPKAAEQRKAQSDAEAERRLLLPRIPLLTVVLEGQPCPSALVTVDGLAIPDALLGQARPANPGKHAVTAQCGVQIALQDANLDEGQSQSISLHIASKPVPPVVKSQSNTIAPLSQVTLTGSVMTGFPNTKSTGSHSAQKTVGWISLGVGGAGLVLGGVTGIILLSKKSTLDGSGQCAGNQCQSPEHGSLTSYNSWRPISTAGFVIGAIGATTGVTLLLTAPKRKESGISAWLGPTSAGMEGQF